MQEFLSDKKCRAKRDLIAREVITSALARSINALSDTFDRIEIFNVLNVYSLFFFLHGRK